MRVRLSFGMVLEFVDLHKNRSTGWSADDAILPLGACLHFWLSFSLHSEGDSFFLRTGVEPGLSKLNTTTAVRCRVVLPVVYYSSGNLTFPTSQ